MRDTDTCLTHDSSMRLNQTRTKPNASHKSHVPVDVTEKHLFYSKNYYSNQITNITHFPGKHNVHLNPPSKPLPHPTKILIPSSLLKEWIALAISLSAFSFCHYQQKVELFYAILLRYRFKDSPLCQICAYHNGLNRTELQ